MVSHHPVRFPGHRHCGSGDKMSLEVEEQVSTSLYTSVIIISLKAWYVMLTNTEFKIKVKNFMQTFSVKSNEICPVLIICVYGNNPQKIHKKL